MQMTSEVASQKQFLFILHLSGSEMPYLIGSYPSSSAKAHEPGPWGIGKSQFGLPVRPVLEVRRAFRGQVTNPQ